MKLRLQNLRRKAGKTAHVNRSGMLSGVLHSPSAYSSSRTLPTSNQLDRVRIFLAVTPFATLAIAVTYLQGYWGAFDILAFPYLNFPELIAYSAAPIFGALLAAAIGALFGAFGPSRGRPSQFAELLLDAYLVGFIFLLSWVNIPFFWVFAPLIVTARFLHRVFWAKYFREIRDAYPALPIVIFISVNLLVISFGYGRSLAVKLKQSEHLNARIIWDTGAIEEVKLIGRLGSHYFYLDEAKQVNVRAEQYVKGLQYLKPKGGD